MPRRIQRKRTKGWRMPPNTVYVGRPSKWGNPLLITESLTSKEVIKDYLKVLTNHKQISREDIKKELKGKNLACWCKLSEECHADILLKIANAR